MFKTIVDIENKYAIDIKNNFDISTHLAIINIFNGRLSFSDGINRYNYEDTTEEILSFILAMYYHQINNYDKMLKFALIAVNKGNVHAMSFLGEYYLMTIENDDSNELYHSKKIL